MGVLNCKCFRDDIKGVNEIITGNNLKPHELVMALDSLTKPFSPKDSSEIFNQKQINFNSINKDKNKINSIPLKLNKESSTEEEIINNDMDFNTMDLCYDIIDSNDENNNGKSIENSRIDDNNDIIKIKKEEDLLEYDDFSGNNNTSNLHKEKIIGNNENYDDKYENEIKNNNILINDKCNINNFINEKIKEQRKNDFEKEGGVNLNEIKEINDNNNKHYNLIIGNNSFNYNYQYNMYNSNYNDMGGNYNIINQKIDEENEENEEFEQDQDIIDISESNTNINNNLNINRCKSSTFSLNEKKNLEKCTNFDNKTTKSELLRTRKGTKIENDGTNNNINYYEDSNNNQKQDDRSVISYEIECVENCNNNNNNNNEEEDLEENKDTINKDGINIDNNTKEKENIKINFINNIELKITDNINKIKEYHDQYIITDAFCDYDPEI